MAKALVIMAAGMGSRFGGNKQTACLGPSDEMLMEYSVYDALKAGFDRIIFVIRPGMKNELQALTDIMRKSNPNVQFILAEQTLEGCTGVSPFRTKPLGTVHALLSAEKYIDSPFAVINADDYYGRNAFLTLSIAIDKLAEAGTAALVSYSLKNTLSRHGAVTRGICSVEKGLLKNIHESFKVKELDSGEIAELLENGNRVLSPQTPVSMNMWAFSNSLLPDIKEYFFEFLTSLSGEDNNSECLLPIMAEQFIEKGKITVYTYPTDSRWFGLTYRSDADDASWELDKRHQDGTYPDKLF